MRRSLSYKVQKYFHRETIDIKPDRNIVFIHLIIGDRDPRIKPSHINQIYLKWK